MRRNDQMSLKTAKYKKKRPAQRVNVDENGKGIQINYRQNIKVTFQSKMIHIINVHILNRD